MTDTAKYLTALADWFVMKGGEVRYDINAEDGPEQDDDTWDDEFDPGHPGDWLPEMHEVRLGDLQIFITEALSGSDSVADVGVLLRAGIPLPHNVVESTLGDLRVLAPDFVTVDVVDEGSGVDVWLVVQLGAAEVEGGDFVGKLEALAHVATSGEAREVGG